jgi:hypothetical protein
MTLKDKVIITEFERLEKRLFGDPNKKLKNFHYTMDKEAFKELDFFTKFVILLLHSNKGNFYV